jgi:hypothetical protein
VKATEVPASASAATSSKIRFGTAGNLTGL